MKRSVFSPRAPLLEHFKDSHTEFPPLPERSASEKFTMCATASAPPNTFWKFNFLILP